MKLMFIQQFQVALARLKNLPAQPTDDTAGGEQVIALDAILIGGELDSDHNTPPLQCTNSPRMSQAARRRSLRQSLQPAGRSAGAPAPPPGDQSHCAAP